MNVYYFSSFLALLVTQALAASHEGHMEESADVLILGAGAAGLAAAKEIYKSGKSFLVIEGLERIGGRVNGFTMQGQTMEVGCPYLTSLTDDNPFTMLKQNLNIEGKVPDYSSFTAYLGRNGDVITDEVSAAEDTMYEALEEITKHAANRQMMNLPDQSLATFLQKIGVNVTEPLRSFMEIDYIDWAYSTTAIETSVYNVYLEGGSYDTGDEFYVADSRGLVEILRDMSKDFIQTSALRNSSLRLGKTVDKISYDADGVTVHTLDNTVYRGKRAIVTFSPGVLRAQKIEFSPPLPDTKVRTINSIQMGHFTPILLRFQSKFWDDTEYIYNVEEKKGYYPVFINIDKIYGVSNNIIMAYLSSDEALRVSSQPINTVLNDVQNVLKTIYKRTFLPTLQEYYIGNWATNPNFMGSVSNWPIGFSEGDAHVLNMPIGKLHFAGDAYARENQGSLFAAYKSGMAKAMETLNCMDPMKPCPLSQFVWGCRYEDALNYNPEATMDDNTCILKVFGCTFQNATNYQTDANTNDGSCLYDDGFLRRFGIDADDINLVFIALLGVSLGLHIIGLFILLCLCGRSRAPRKK